MAVPLDKATGNIILICKIFYASLITRELGLNNNPSTDTYNNTDGVSVNDIIDKNIRDLKIKFDIDKVPIENHRLPNMYWMPKLYKNTLIARFVIASPKSSIKSIASNITSVFCSFVFQTNTSI